MGIWEIYILRLLTASNYSDYQSIVMNSTNFCLLQYSRDGAHEILYWCIYYLVSIRPQISPELLLAFPNDYSNIVYGHVV